MRHLRPEAMFHLLWALWHAIRIPSGSERFFRISRSDLHKMPTAFADLIHSLDPSEFWNSEEGIALQTSGTAKMQTLLLWHDHIDGYLRHKCMCIASNYSSFLTASHLKALLMPQSVDIFITKFGGRFQCLTLNGLRESMNRQKTRRSSI